MKPQPDNEWPPLVSVTENDIQKVDQALALQAAKRKRKFILGLAITGYIFVPIGIAVAFRSQVGVNRSNVDRAWAPWQIAAGVLIFLIGVAMVIAARCLYRPDPIVRSCGCGYCGVCKHERSEDRVGGMGFPDFLYAAYSVGWNPVCPQCGNRW